MALIEEEEEVEGVEEVEDEVEKDGDKGEDRLKRNLFIQRAY